MLFFGGIWTWKNFDKVDSVLEPVGAAIFAILFLMPFTFPGIAILTFVLFAMDQKGSRSVWYYALVWAAAGMCFAIYSPKPAAVLLPITLPAGALIGVVYWAMTGRVAGRPELFLNDFFDRPLRSQLAIWVGVMFAAVAVSWIYIEAVKSVGPI